MIRRRGRAGVLAFGLCVPLAAAYAWTALNVYAMHVSPDVDRAGRATGPSGAQFMQMAEESLSRSRRVLNDRSLDTIERLGRSRAALEAAQTELLAALRTRPIGARTLAALFAVRWELNPPRTRKDVDDILDSVRLAGEMAPNDPTVQLSLSELLLRAGLRDVALSFATRTVELDSTSADDVVELLAVNAFSAEEILVALPRADAILIALRNRFYRGAEGSAAYLHVLEDAYPKLAELPRALFPGYAAACLRAGKADILLQTVETRLRSGDAGDELLTTYHARALVTLSRVDEALEIAQSGFERFPGSVGMAALVGDVAMTAQRPGVALPAFRAGLGIVARGSGSPSGRARFYRSIGRAEEALGEGARAYDAYKLAVEANNDEWSKKRLATLGAVLPSD